MGLLPLALEPVKTVGICFKEHEVSRAHANHTASVRSYGFDEIEADGRPK